MVSIRLGLVASTKQARFDKGGDSEKQGLQLSRRKTGPLRSALVQAYPVSPRNPVSRDEHALL